MYVGCLVLFFATSKMVLSTSKFVTKSAFVIRFRIVSYNILADLYADSDVSRTELFPYCPPYALNIDYRKQLILKELLGEYVMQSIS
jgi:mRNA deadenylase 3'-5' endonuclease subunit Ccr4